MAFGYYRIRHRGSHSAPDAVPSASIPAEGAVCPHASCPAVPAWPVKPHRFQFALTSRAVNCDISAADVLQGWGHCALPAPCPWLSKLRSWEEKQPVSLFIPLQNGDCWSRSCSVLLVSHSVYYQRRSRSWPCWRKALTFTALST